MLLLICIFVESTSSKLSPISPLPPISIPNFRQVSPLIPHLYRSLTLDAATASAAGALLSLNVTRVINLRNSDEVPPSLSPGLEALYAAGVELVHIHLMDVDGLFLSPASFLPPMKRAQAYWFFAFNPNTREHDGLIVEEIAAKGNRVLYKSIMKSARKAVAEAVAEGCSGEEGGAVVVFCQKGKDRTGIVAALAAARAGEEEGEIVRQYAMSEALLRKGGVAGAPQKPSEGGMDRERR